MIDFEYVEGNIIHGVTLMANGVYVGDLLEISQGKYINWCAIQGEFKCRFALRNEATFNLVLDEIKRYCLNHDRKGIVVSSYTSGGIRGFFPEEFWKTHGFKEDNDAPGALLFLKV